MKPTLPRYIPISGYLHFYRSLLLYTSIRPHLACQMLYDLYTGNLDTCQGMNAPIFGSEMTFSDFCRLLLRTQVRPYYTPVQLYRAMEDIFRNVRFPFITTDSRKALKNLHALGKELAFRFEQIYDMDIADPRTCYARCRPRLTSYPEEPFFCIPT